MDLDHGGNRAEGGSDGGSSFTAGHGQDPNHSLDRFYSQSPPEHSYPSHMERDLLGRPNGRGYGDQLGRGPGSPALSERNRERERDRDRDRDLGMDSRRSGERNRSRQRNGRSASGQVRLCKKCGEPLTGQFVRALDGTFHLDCFKCRVS